MSIFLAGAEAHMEGDWTLTGAARNIESLASLLHQLETGNEKILRIDCKNVIRADASGLQVLHVWLECVRMRGVEPTLHNIPEKMLKIMKT